MITHKCGVSPHLMDHGVAQGEGRACRLVRSQIIAAAAALSRPPPATALAAQLLPPASATATALAAATPR